jgi:hypothetical protein
VDAVAAIFAEEFSAALGNLARVQLFAAKPSRPVRDERAMGRAGHSIFVDPALRREEARDKIAIVARRGNDDAADWQLNEAFELRSQRGDLRCSVEDREVIGAFKHLSRFRA